jgi:hypothetical protein
MHVPVYGFSSCMRYMLSNEVHVDPEELVLPGGSNEAKTSKGKFRDKFHGKICINLPPLTDLSFLHQLEFATHHLVAS